MAKKKAAASAPESSSIYITLRRVRHDGEIYGIGEEIELLPSQAVDLIAHGAIVSGKVVSEPSEVAE